MRFEFNRTGAERKALVQAMGEILEVKPKYLGMPTAAYQVNYFHIDKNGGVEFDDRADSEEIENLLERLAERGIVAAPATAQEADTAAESADAENNAEEPETEAQGADLGLTVAMPRDSFTDAALENLRKLVDAKGSLIKKALAVDSLPIETDGEKVSFPWFAKGQDSEAVKAYTHFMRWSSFFVTLTRKSFDIIMPAFFFQMVSYIHLMNVGGYDCNTHIHNP